ncbi:MAG: acetate uptake transporter [Acetobacteraceae bacterium]
MEDKVESKFGNPVPLGLFGFASTTWLLSMVNAGWASGAGLGIVLSMALVYGGTVQGLAGVFAYIRGNTFASVAFLSYGAFWWSFAVFVKFFVGKTPDPFIGWYLFVWGVFTFYMWIATFRHNMALQLVFLTLWITYLLLAIAKWFGMAEIGVIGGYVGLICALCAAYLSAAEIINGDYKREVLPIGSFSR